jgi:cardiolipin synthase
MPEKFRWTIPNILSLYRIFISPVIAFTVYLNLRTFFTVLIVISLFTDILDGYIARKFKLQTPLGAILDSMADALTTLVAIAGMFRFEYLALKPFILPLCIMILMWAFVYVVSLIKFKKLCSLHLYSSKAAGYAQGIFLFVLFCFGFNQALFWGMFIISVLSYSEEIAALLILKELKSDAKGIYRIIKTN